MANGNKKQKGMTLLEVMVALVIFSTAALALMNSVSLNVRFTHGLADTLQATWVAENQLAEAQLTKTDFPDAEQQGTEIMGGRRWNWRKQRMKTADNVWANTIRVYAEGDESQPVISLHIIPPERASEENATPARIYFRVNYTGNTDELTLRVVSQLQVNNEAGEIVTWQRRYRMIE